MKCTWTSTLRMEAASFAVTLYLLTALKGHKEIHLLPEPQLRNAESTGKMERWEDTSHSPEDHRGESPAELVRDSAFSQWTLMKPYRVLGEILITPSLLPLLQQKPNAFCFECLVATSPYLIPWVYNCSPACTCPKLPRALISFPNRLLPLCHPSHWLSLHVTKKFVSFFCCHLSSKEIHYYIVWNFLFVLFSSS